MSNSIEFFDAADLKRRLSPHSRAPVWRGTSNTPAGALPGPGVAPLSATGGGIAKRRCSFNHNRAKFIAANHRHFSQYENITLQSLVSVVIQHMHVSCSIWAIGVMAKELNPEQGYCASNWPWIIMRTSVRHQNVGVFDRHNERQN